MLMLATLKFSPFTATINSRINQNLQGSKGGPQMAGTTSTCFTADPGVDHWGGAGGGPHALSARSLEWSRPMELDGGFCVKASSAGSQTPSGSGGACVGGGLFLFM